MGNRIGAKVEITQLPQTVAAFHALVGLAAMMTSISSFMMLDHMSNFHSISAYFGTFIGGMTLTGSIAAYIKLANLYSDKNLHLPAQQYLNIPLAAVSATALF